MNVDMEQESNTSEEVGCLTRPLHSLRMDTDQSGYSGPEVGFEEIATHLPEARFWITSGWPTIREQAALDS
jgi:hypothetical protein